MGVLVVVFKASSRDVRDEAGLFGDEHDVEDEEDELDGALGDDSDGDVAAEDVLVCGDFGGEAFGALGQSGEDGDGEEGDDVAPNVLVVGEVGSLAVEVEDGGELDEDVED